MSLSCTCIGIYPRHTRVRSEEPYIVNGESAKKSIAPQLIPSALMIMSPLTMCTLATIIECDDNMRSLYCSPIELKVLGKIFTVRSMTCRLGEGHVRSIGGRKIHKCSSAYLELKSDKSYSRRDSFTTDLTWDVRSVTTLKKLRPNVPADRGP